MPWIDPIDDYAVAPRLPRARSSLPTWDGDLDVIDGDARLEGVKIEGGALDLSSKIHLELVASELTGVTFTSERGGSAEIIDCVLVDCDLSQLRVKTIRGSRLSGCKLTGADLSGRVVQDVEFVRCNLSYANLRMSELERLAFTRCRLVETDIGDANIADMAFEGSELEAVNLDRSRLENVDFRAATRLQLTSVTNLGGCLLSDAQVLGLGYQLAISAGASVERDHDPSE